MGSSIVTNVLLWWGVLLTGEAVREWARSVRKLSVPSAQFFCETKTALKSSLLKKKRERDRGDELEAEVDPGF